MRVKEIVGRLEADGWRLLRTRGSHRQFTHSTKPGKVTVSGKLNVDMPSEALSSVRKQAGPK